MNDLEQLALAALVHDLPVLLAATSVSTDAQRILDLASLDHPPLAAILEQAQDYAAPGSDDRAKLVSDALLSVFSHIQLDQGQKPPLSYYPLAPLPATYNSQEKLFPGTAKDPTGLAGHLQKLASELDWLGAAVDVERFERVYQHLLALLQRYTWCLPAHRQDVALCDHVKLTSAIAVCLYRYHQADLSAEAVRDAAQEERFCLLVGDLSGIQDYIFGITTTGAGGVARRLRARSFYLSALSDVLSHQIARRFDLPLGNVIMSSGGKFFILLPNRGDVDARIQAIRREIDAELREEFNGEIAVNLAHVCFAGERFRAGSQTQAGFGDVMADVSRKLNRAKRRSGQGVLLDEAGWDEAAFVVERDFWGVGACASCGKFPAQQAGSLCKRCERDVQVGKRLPHTRYVAYYDAGYEHPPGDESIPMPLKCSIRILAQDELAQAGQPYLLVKLNDPDVRELAGHAGSFRYLANYLPMQHANAQMDFEQIAAQAEGRALLGYVKADVDYLGILFAQGLRRDGGGYDTATHVAALSRELDLFFSGWIQHALSRGEGGQHFYTIFSGGDDLFLVGPWDQAVGLARRIRDEFAAFVGHNPAITLSAGVLFAKERYPISRAARDAEHALELSKEGSPTHAQKRNQLTLLGDTFAWDTAPHIFAEVEMLRKRSDFLTSAFLYDLIEYGRMYRMVRAGQVEGLRYKAMFAYNIARNLRKGDLELYRWADELMQSLHGKQESLTMQHIGLVATYLLFARRGRS